MNQDDLSPEERQALEKGIREAQAGQTVPWEDVRQTLKYGRTDYKTFLYTYRFEDEEWGFEIQALNEEEAEQRIRSLAFYGRLLGEKQFNYQIPWGWNWLAELIVRFRNWLARRKDN